MKTKNYIFWILFIVEVVFIVISQILLYYGEKGYLSDREFVSEFNSYAIGNYFTDEQKKNN